LLRTYGGLFENYVNIHENELAKNMHISHTQVYEGLNKLKGFMIVDYQKTSDAPKITFLTGRMRDENIILTKAVYADRMADEKKRMKAIRAYVEHEICRSVQLLSYFGEKDSDNCGVCDICRKNKTKPISEHEYDNLESKVNVLLTESPKTIEQILESLSEENKDDVYNLIRWKLDHKQWVMSSEFNISIKNN
jgi:ATP-dependent DNA helicase RecQ